MVEQRVAVSRVEGRVIEGSVGRIPGLKDGIAMRAGLGGREICVGSMSIPCSAPGDTASAKPIEIVPGPQPRSSRRMPGLRCGNR